jgi:hypothetical protein
VSLLCDRHRASRRVSVRAGWAPAAYERVLPLARESVSLARELGNREKIGCALTTLASLASARDDALLAARLFGAAAALRETIGVPMSPAEQALHEQFLARARGQVSEAAWSAAEGAGRAEPLDPLLERTLDELAV